MSQNRDYPGNLPLLPMGWGAAKLDFDGDEDFWDEVERVTAGSSLGDNLDIALAGESSPRIWLFLHEPGHGSLSTAAALAIARELGNRDQAVLILDCDDTDSQLTRWVGRHESEGWIDLVRYGASVLTGGVAMPFPGRRGYVLGVGSFTPTDVEADEAEDLINRLKRQADDLILVAAANESGKLWAGLADLRLLCWDRARKSPELIERVCSNFENSGNQLTGLIGFGLPDEGMALGSGTVSRTDDQRTPGAPLIEDEDAFTEEDPDERLEADDLQDVDYSDPDVDAEDDPVEPDPDPTPSDPGESESDLGEEDAEFVPGMAPAPGSGSSRVFWGAALVSLLLIAVVSVYYLKYVRPGDEDAQVDTPAIVAQQQPQEQTIPLEDEVPSTDISDQMGQDVLPETTAVEDSLIRDAVEAADQPAQSLPIQAESNDADTSEVEPAEVVSEIVETDAPVFSMDPYLGPVGADGWALHLYSFPDRPSAEAETRRLERRGFQTTIRPMEIEGKGLWYRVYVGSFTSKSEARQSQGPLMKKLKVDWARATEF